MKIQNQRMLNCLNLILTGMMGEVPTIGKF